MNREDMGRIPNAIKGWGIKLMNQLTCNCG
jgi:hypothetical protein